jgi:hypothetical protein
MAPNLFAHTIRDHLVLHRRAGEDPVTRLLLSSSFVVVIAAKLRATFRLVRKASGSTRTSKSQERRDVP